ncbi:hypothetical protein V1503_22835 [Bacillus sp. SCS-151]|uniref:hypothetical protein n=1 Tax=Nanhaiella sioensis TaxID=3115293 RepID=UPI00397B0F52
MEKIYFDFWYLKSEEVELDGSDTARISYEIAISVFADPDYNHLLDDIRITGLDKDQMLMFKINKPEELFSKLEEEGLQSVVADIKATGSYTVMGSIEININE